MNGFGLNAGVNGFMKGYGFMNNIQRQETADQQRADAIDYQHGRDVKTDEYRQQTLGIQKSASERQGKLTDAQLSEIERKRTDAQHTQFAGMAYHALGDYEKASVKEKPAIAEMMLQGVNSDPYFAKHWKIGGDTGRHAVGLEQLPNGGYVLHIQNDKTGTTGPMTANGSSDPKDQLVHFSKSQLAFAAGIDLQKLGAREKLGLQHKNKMAEIGAKAKENKLSKINQKDYTNNSWKKYLKTGNKSELIAYRKPSKSTQSASVTKSELASVQSLLENSGIDSSVAGKAAYQSAVYYKNAIKGGASQQEALQQVLQGVKLGVSPGEHMWNSDKYDPSQVNFTNKAPKPTSFSNLWGR